MKTVWCINLLFSVGTFVQNTNAHGYVQSPRSRNYRANQLGIEFDHNGLNRKDSTTNDYGSGLCGVVRGHNYDNFMNEHGWNTEAIYTEGQNVSITTHLTAYHGGHFEFGACVVEDGIFQNSPSQNCFDNNKLVYIDGGHPLDDIYPHRAYLGLPSSSALSSADFFTHNFRLPDGLKGTRVLLQWRYFTGNSCKYDGYDEYFESQGWGASNLPVCNFDIDNTGDGPERFWNCMEVTIEDGDGSPPSPTTAPPTTRPSLRPTNPTTPTTPTTPPPTFQTSSPVDPNEPATCGGGNRGNGVCDQGLCCSQWGWCGATSSHCLTFEDNSDNSNNGGCCSWNDLGCGGSQWCDQDQSTCESVDCGGTWLE